MKEFKVDGKNKSSEGLYDDQIDKVMSRYKDFKGCIMKDQTKTVLPDIKPHSRVAFIINTQNSDKPGQHWQCIYIDARDQNQVIRLNGLIASVVQYRKIYLMM